MDACQTLLAQAHPTALRKKCEGGTECDDASKIKSLGPHPIRIISSHLTSHCRSIMSYDFSVICKVVRREGMCTLTNDLA